MAFSAGTRVRSLTACAIAAGLSGPAGAAAEPPYEGTIFITPDLITSQDPSSYKSARYVRRTTRTVYDRRRESFKRTRVHLVRVRFRDAKAADALVNVEFGGKSAALREARKYARVIGRTPAMVRKNLKTITIHRGVHPFGGNNDGDALIHTGQAADYSRAGILEETFVHELAHVSLDEKHSATPGWLAAQKDDPDFISAYARDNPEDEDIAESIVPWLAVTLGAERTDDEIEATIRRTIPGRLAYFDRQRFDLSPFAG